VGKFLAGQSGNPSGRPAVVRDFRERCRQFMEKSGWNTLQNIATDPKSLHQLRALELVAAYGYGRPTQPVSGDPDPDMPPVRVTVTFDRAEAPDQPTTT
jgi:hypothetical protein